MRNLRAHPRSQVVSIITGEVQSLRHFAGQGGRTVSAPYTGNECIYFYYHEEREEVYTDSDGDRQTRWVTVERYSRRVPEFRLADSSSKVTVTTDNADFSVPSHTYYGSDYRYTEARFEPGEETFIFGYASQSAEHNGKTSRTRATTHPLYPPTVRRPSERTWPRAASGYSRLLCCLSPAASCLPAGWSACTGCLCS